jgi:hypothetical protein
MNRQLFRKGRHCILVQLVLKDFVKKGVVPLKPDYLIQAFFNNWIDIHPSCRKILAKGHQPARGCGVSDDNGSGCGLSAQGVGPRCRTAKTSGYDTHNIEPCCSTAPSLAQMVYSTCLGSADRYGDRDRLELLFNASGIRTVSGNRRTDQEVRYTESRKAFQQSKLHNE